jgi:hypothetical protein
MFNDHVAQEHTALAFAVIRRAEAAIDEWELACEVATQGVQKPSKYFKALRHTESCVSALWQGLAFGQKALGTKLYDSGDGSVFERLNQLYNKGRHFDPSQLPNHDLHALWLTNDGLRSRDHTVTFDEMRDTLRILCNIAQKIAAGIPGPEERVR